MNNSTFNTFLQVLKSTKFSDDKISVIKQQLRNYLMTSEQIKVVLETFTMDSDRLTAAKLAYNRCVDPNNYFVVYPSFRYQSSAQELRDYISRF